MKNLKVQDLEEHRKSFYIGSILPDLTPSFITRRHTIDETFDTLINEIKKITVNYDINKGINRYYARHLGVITHYLSDYCTYPHNDIFEGSIAEHVHYEKELKYSLREYVNSDHNKRERKPNENCCSLDEIVHLILQIHKEYLAALKTINKDIQYIIDLCYKVVDAILTFFEMAFHQLHNNLDQSMVCI